MHDADEDLMDRYVRGEASEGDVAKLSQLLRNNPQAVHNLVNAAEMERDLQEVFRSGRSFKRKQKQLPARPKPRAARTSAKPVPWASVAAVAACVMLAIGLYLAFRTVPETATVVEAASKSILIRGGRELSLASGTVIEAGDEIDVPPYSTVTLSYTDDTKVQIGSTANEKSIAFFADSTEVKDRKNIRLESGVVQAQVSKQPAGRPMMICTPKAVAEVLGTHLRMAVESDSTRLEVIEGKVKMLRVQDKAEAYVLTGQYAVAAAASDFTPKAIASRNPHGRVIIAADDRYQFYLNGSLIGQHEWPKGVWLYEADTFDVNLLPGKNVIAVRGVNIDNIAGLLAEIQFGNQRLITSRNWKVSRTVDPNWTSFGFDDSRWVNATELGPERQIEQAKHAQASRFPTDTQAQWIWSSNNHFSTAKENDNEVFFRFTFEVPTN